MREESFLEPGQEHRVEFEPFRRVHRHQLQRVGAFARLMLAGFQRRMREERGERIDCFARFDLSLRLGEGLAEIARDPSGSLRVKTNSGTVLSAGTMAKPSCAISSASMAAVERSSCMGEASFLTEL